MFAAFFVIIYLLLSVLGLPCCRGFLWLWPLSRCGTWASHCGGFSHCGAQASELMGFSGCGAWAHLLQLPGPRAQVQ